MELSLKNYVALTKPGIIMGNLLTAAAGFALGATRPVNYWLLIHMIIGLSLIVGSACVFNNAIDREMDKKMHRTKRRPLALGVISLQNALIYATALVFVGSFFLLIYTNAMAMMVALFGFFFYVLVYSFAKYKTVHGTLIGSIAGAVPPVVGYCAVKGALDSGALVIFAMVALWQMPHFFSIAIYRMKDYEAASIPVFPIKRGLFRTKIQMALYIFAFIGASTFLTRLGYTGYAYLTVMSLVGIFWLTLSLKGFKAVNDTKWARQMFIASLIVVTALSLMIPIDR